MKPRNQIEQLQQELDALDVWFEDAAERWLEARAAGSDTKTIEAEISAAEAEQQKLQRNLTQAQQRRR